jgi:hypothetical protein
MGISWQITSIKKYKGLSLFLPMTDADELVMNYSIGNTSDFCINAPASANVNKICSLLLLVDFFTF